MPGLVIGGQGEGPSNTTEILRSHRWRIATLGDIQLNRLTIAPKELQLPNFTVETESHQGGSVVYKYAKSVNWEDVSLTFYDTVNLYSAIDEWREKVWSDANGIGIANDYKKRTEFELYDGAGNTIFIYTLINSWPKKFAHGPLSMASSDIKVISLVLSYDWIEWIAFGEGEVPTRSSNTSTPNATVPSPSPPDNIGDPAVQSLIGANAPL